jgi:hypothetical protein
MLGGRTGNRESPVSGGDGEALEDSVPLYPAAYLPVSLAAEQAPPRPKFKSFEERVSFNGF